MRPPPSPTALTVAVLALVAVLQLGCGRPGSTPAGHRSSSASDDDDAANRLVAQGIAALEGRQYAAAIPLFESALRHRPDATVFALLGDCYWSQWKHGHHDPKLLEQASVHYRKGLVLDGRHCGLNHALGRDLVLLHRPAEALPFLNSARACCVNRPLEAQNLWFRIQALVAIDRVDMAKDELAVMTSRFAGNQMTERAGRLLAEQTQDPDLLARWGGNPGAAAARP